MKALETSQMATVKANGWCDLFLNYSTACKAIVIIVAATA